MNVTVAAVGKMKSGPELDLFNHYKKSFRDPVTVVEVECKKNLPPSEKKEWESSALLSAVPKGAYVLLLDERGKEMTSVEFAGFLQKLMEDGREAIFLIGGADGHSETLKSRADFKLSFGRMTWPHILARVFLMEQLYRAKTILTGHPYHRE